MALNSTDLENDIKPDLKDEIVAKLNQHLPAPSDPSLAESDKSAFDKARSDLATALSEAIAKIVSEKVVSHIVSNLEIKGVEVTIPGNTYSTGAGAAAALVPTDLVVNQSNDGTGRVA